mmetsp:Transcript_142063/g.247534  ORF Transcript_142063/g.247534 Transcript_142063/m.247534 type:complete len:298 (-) Transcript_142063:57-950(-)
MAELNEVHKAQIARFLQFFKGKRDRLLNDRQAACSEYLSDHLADDSALFNSKNVQDLVSNFHIQAQTELGQELDKIVNLSGVYLSQLLARAEMQYGLTLEAEDIALVEDANKIAEVSALSAMRAAPPLSPLANRQQPLAPLAAATSGSDPALVAQLQEAQEENRQMKDRYQLMQSEVSSLLQQRSNLSAELEKVKTNFTYLRMRMAETSTDATSNAHVAEIERSLHDTKSSLDSKSAECEAMRQDLTRRLADSSQFRELKAMVKQKSGQVKELRQQLMAAGLAPAGGDFVELEPEDD